MRLIEARPPPAPLVAIPPINAETAKTVKCSYCAVGERLDGGLWTPSANGNRNASVSGREA